MIMMCMCMYVCIYIYICLIVYDYIYIWLCIYIYMSDCIWLNMIIYIYMSDCIWIYMIMYDYVWLCTIVYDYVWLCAIVYDYIWLYAIIYDYTGLYIYIWLYMIYDGRHVKSYIIVVSREYHWISMAGVNNESGFWGVWISWQTSCLGNGQANVWICTGIWPLCSLAVQVLDESCGPWQLKLRKMNENGVSMIRCEVPSESTATCFIITWTNSESWDQVGKDRNPRTVDLKFSWLQLVISEL